MAGSQASKHDVTGFAPKLQQYAPLNSDGEKNVAISIATSTSTSVSTHLRLTSGTFFFPRNQIPELRL